MKLELNLRIPIAKIGAISLAGTGQDTKCIILGGMDERFNRLRHVEIFSGDLLTFSPIEDMKYCRSFNPGSGAHLVNGKLLYVIGGANSKDGGEMYDLTKMN